MTSSEGYYQIIRLTTENGVDNENQCDCNITGYRESRLDLIGACKHQDIFGLIIPDLCKISKFPHWLVEFMYNPERQKTVNPAGSLYRDNVSILQTLKTIMDENPLYRAELCSMKNSRENKNRDDENKCNQKLIEIVQTKCSKKLDRPYHMMKIYTDTGHINLRTDSDNCRIISIDDNGRIKYDPTEHLNYNEPIIEYRDYDHGYFDDCYLYQWFAIMMPNI